MIEWALDEWRELALCREVDSELFFPEIGGPTKPAKKICARCDVIAECRQWAVETQQPHGVLGGMTVNERKELWGPPLPRAVCVKGLHSMRDPRNVRDEDGVKRCRGCEEDNRRKWRAA